MFALELLVGDVGFGDVHGWEDWKHGNVRS